MPQRRFLATTVTAVVALSAAFSFGLFAGATKTFPYAQVRSAKRYASELLFGRASFLSEPNGAFSRKDRVTHFATFSPRSDFVMVGDSITQKGIWHEIFPGKRIANRGVKGDTSSDISNRVDSILNVKPKKVFMMFGINDVLQSRPTASIIRNYRQTVHRLRKAEVDVIIQSTIECSRAQCGDRLEAVRDLNVNLKRFARQEGLLFVDLNDDLTSLQDGLSSQYTSDGIHLLGDGYGVWARKIKPFLD